MSVNVRGENVDKKKLPKITSILLDVGVVALTLLFGVLAAYYRAYFVPCAWICIDLSPLVHFLVFFGVAFIYTVLRFFVTRKKVVILWVILVILYGGVVAIEGVTAASNWWQFREFFISIFAF